MDSMTSCVRRTLPTDGVRPFGAHPKLTSTQPDEGKFARRRKASFLPDARGVTLTPLPRVNIVKSWILGQSRRFSSCRIRPPLPFDCQGRV